MKITLNILFFTVAFFYSCDFIDDDTYTTPCRGKFGSQKVLDSITNNFKLGEGNIFFRDSYYHGIGEPANCDTITINTIEGFPINITDTFLKVCSKYFFRDSANVNIKCLRIGAYEYSKGGTLISFYELGRSSSFNYIIPAPLIDTNIQAEYKIINDEGGHSYNKFIGNKDFWNVYVSCPTEPRDIKKIADEMMHKYSVKLQNKNVEAFTVLVKIETPSIKYCTEKNYWFRYYKSSSKPEVFELRQGW